MRIGACGLPSAARSLMNRQADLTVLARTSPRFLGNACYRTSARASLVGRREGNVIWLQVASSFDHEYVYLGTCLDYHPDSQLHITFLWWGDLKNAILLNRKSRRPASPRHARCAVSRLSTSASSPTFSIISRLVSRARPGQASFIRRRAWLSACTKLVNILVGVGS